MTGSRALAPDGVRYLPPFEPLLASLPPEQAEFLRELLRERAQSEALAEVARAVNGSLRLDEVLDLTLRHTVALLGSDGAGVVLKRGDDLEVVATVGTAQPLLGRRMPYEGSLNGSAMREGSPIISNDVHRDARFHRPIAAVAEITRTMIAPMITARGAIGTLAVLNRETAYGDADLLVLQRLADQVAVAIVNAQLFEEVERAWHEWEVAFDAVAVGMVVLDADRRIRSCNSRALALADAPDAKALRGRSFHEAVLRLAAPPDDSPVTDALVHAQVSRGAMRAPARGLIFDVVASPHPNGGAVVTFDDVTSFHALAERHRRVVETSSDAIVITDPLRRIAFANPAALALFGYTAEAISGIPVDDVVLAELRDDVARRERAALEGVGQRYETVIVRANGERRTVEVSTAPLKDLGEITGVVASLRDVTEEREARDAMLRSEARYRNLVESATDAIFTVDARGLYSSANRATCLIMGHDRSDLLGRDFLGGVVPDDLQSVTEHFRAALGGQSRRYECRVVRRGGERRTLSVTNTPIYHGADVVGVLGIARDVTLQRERDEALVRSEARYARLVESASDGIFTVDEAGAFVSANRSLERSVGRSERDLAGTSFMELVEPEDHETMGELFAGTLRGERRRAEMRFRDARGLVRTGSITMTPIVAEGRVTGGLGVVRDVTDERRLSEQLLQREKLAAVGQLVSGVAHELNNPLAGIAAFSQLLLASTPASAEQHEALVTINKEARRAGKIVSNLLLFARQRHPERGLTDLNQVMLDTLELRRYVLHTAQIEVVTDLDPELPITWADPFQLQQVLLNLLTNAEHAVRSSPGAKRIVLRTRRDGERVVATVEDSGPGIQRDVLDRIFNPFYTTKPVGEGTGLGLSISDGIVREHGGQITVHTAPGQGATFNVELPIVPPPAADTMLLCDREE